MRNASKAARTRVWMIGVNDKIWFLREGLFAKYVMSLVGLVVFVLAVNGATETWISYRATKTTLIDAMSEKAEATARRIEQSISELERQISWVTRSSAKTYSGVVTLEDHHADYVQLRSEEHTSELQSQSNLVCRLLLEKKKKKISLLFVYIKKKHTTITI